MEENYSYQAKLVLYHVPETIKTEEDLIELKQALSNFYAARADRMLDKMWENGTLDQKKLDELRGKHLRTPYIRK